jgi:hypothetical protein
VAFLNEAAEGIVSEGFKITHAARRGAGGDVNAIEIGPDHPEVCPDLALLAEVLKCVPVTHPELESYDAWVTFLRAIKTACAGDHDFYTRHVIEWAAGNPDNMVNEGNDFDAKWESFTTSAVGWGYLCNIAHGAGFIGDVVREFEALPETDTTVEDARVARYRGRWPDEGEALPDLEFWDEDGILPRGQIGIMYGDKSTHKTGLTITMLLDAVEHRGARVCYAAGEGAHGVEKIRVPAHCRARGISTKDLRGRWRTVAAIPPFPSTEETTAFIKAQQDLHPDLVVFDTLATALAGEDENGSRAAAFLTGNGPAGRVRRAFNATVLLPAHQGKDPTKGVRGHSGFGGNVDFILQVTAHESGAVKLYVEKMRDGRCDFAVYFRAPPKGSPEIPVPVRISEAEYKALTGSNSGDDGAGRESEIRGILALHEAYGPRRGLDDDELAKALVGVEPKEENIDTLTAWRTRFEKAKKGLRNARRAKWARLLGEESTRPGGRKLVWLWFLPETEQPAASGDGADIEFARMVVGSGSLGSGSPL